MTAKLAPGAQHGLGPVWLKPVCLQFRYVESEDLVESRKIVGVCWGEVSCSLSTLRTITLAMPVHACLLV